MPRDSAERRARPETGFICGKFLDLVPGLRRPNGPLGVRPAKGPPDLLQIGLTPLSSTNLNLPGGQIEIAEHAARQRREACEARNRLYLRKIPSPGPRGLAEPDLFPRPSFVGSTGCQRLKSVYQSVAYAWAMRFRLFPVWLSFLMVVPLAALAADGAGDQKAPEHKITQSKSYLSLEPIYTTIVDDNRVQGMLMVGIGLDVPNPALRDVVTRSMPVLRDAYVRNLMAFTATSVRPNAQPDVVQIADRLQGVTDRALGRKGAKILLAQVAIRVIH